MTNVLSSVHFIRDHEVIQTPRICSNGHEIALKLENCENEYASCTENYMRLNVLILGFSILNFHYFHKN